VCVIRSLSTQAITELRYIPVSRGVSSLGCGRRPNTGSVPGELAVWIIRFELLSKQQAYYATTDCDFHGFHNQSDKFMKADDSRFAGLQMDF
jgi:hypothetical protein